MSIWRIYYGDGTTCSNIEGATDGGFTPETCPSTNVQIIIIPDVHLGRLVVHKKDYYYFDTPSSEWYGVDGTGLLQAMTALGVGRLHDAAPLQQYQVKKLGTWINTLNDWQAWVAELCAMKIVKCGQTMGNDPYRTLYETAIYDPAFPKKNGYYEWERQPENWSFVPPA